MINIVTKAEHKNETKIKVEYLKKLKFYCLKQSVFSMVKPKSLSKSFKTVCIKNCGFKFSGTCHQ